MLSTFLSIEIYINDRKNNNTTEISIVLAIAQISQ